MSDRGRGITLTPLSLSMLDKYRRYLQETQHLHGTLSYSIYERMTSLDYTTNIRNGELHIDIVRDYKDDGIKGSTIELVNIINDIELLSTL